MKKSSLFICMCLLSGCSLLGTDESPPLYTLKGRCLQQTSALSAPLAIDLPMCESSLDTPQIAITPSPYQRTYFADGQWSDRLSKVLQQVFVETYSQRWGGKYVSQVGAGLQATYVLQSDVQEFSVYHLDKPHPEVRVKILFKLLDFRNRTVLAARPFCETAQASSVTMRAIVKAFNRALHALIAKSTPWMEESFSL